MHLSIKSFIFSLTSSVIPCIAISFSFHNGIDLIEKQSESFINKRTYDIAKEE